MTTDIDEFEDKYDALKAMVRKLGGTTKIGKSLWPEMLPQDARTRINNCLNRDRAEKLDTEQEQLLFKWCCDIGYHDAKHWCDRDAGYAASIPLSQQAEIPLAPSVSEIERRIDERVERAVMNALEKYQGTRLRSVGEN